MFKFPSAGTLPVRTIAVALALAVTSSSLHAQITNGGFEAPVVPAGGYTAFSTGASFAGWTVVGAQGDIDLVSTTFTQFGISFPAHSGSQWVDLTGLSNTTAGVAQSFATVTGQAYDLSFWVGNVSGGLFGTTSTVNVFLNGTAFMSATNIMGTTTQVWEQFMMPFTATSAMTTLAFINGDPAYDNANGLDDVMVTSASPVTSTPEPSSVVLLATGLAGVLGVSRRRSRTTSNKN